MFLLHPGERNEVCSSSELYVVKYIVMLLHFYGWNSDCNYLIMLAYIVAIDRRAYYARCMTI